MTSSALPNQNMTPTSATRFAAPNAATERRSAGSSSATKHTVYGIAYRRLRNHAESQEVCQDVFIQAMRKIGQLHDPACFGAWVRSIADRMAINRVARRRPAESTDSHGFDVACVERETPLSVVLGRERTDQVHQGLSRLRTLDRKTLTAFYFDGRSLVEMSDEFDSPVGTIKRRLHVAQTARQGIGGDDRRLAGTAQEKTVADSGGQAGDGTGREIRSTASACGCGIIPGASTPSFSSSSSWMMIRGVTIIIRLEVSRPMPTFLNRRLM